jgi:hypothetical protein
MKTGTSDDRTIFDAREARKRRPGPTSSKRSTTCVFPAAKGVEGAVCVCLSMLDTGVCSVPVTDPLAKTIGAADAEWFISLHSTTSGNQSRYVPDAPRQSLSSSVGPPKNSSGS